jgi:hypothetical protein
LITYFKQRQAAFYAPDVGPDLGPGAGLKELQDWVLACPCALHDAHNGLKRGLAKHCGGTVLHYLHIAIQALRNSFGFLRSQMLVFLRLRVRVNTEPYDEDATREYWAIVGADATVLDDLVAANLKWQDGVLWVSSAFWEKDPEAWEKLIALVHYGMK